MSEATNLSVDTVPDNSRRPRCREIGIGSGWTATGSLNSITDVKGVKVGHSTLISGEGKLVVSEGATSQISELIWNAKSIRTPTSRRQRIYEATGSRNLPH
jgi:hypothetical protein